MRQGRVSEYGAVPEVWEIHTDEALMIVRDTYRGCIGWKRGTGVWAQG